MEDELEPKFYLGYDFADGLGKGQEIGAIMELPNVETTKWLVKNLVVYGGEEFGHVQLHAWDPETREHFYAREDGEWDRDYDDKQAPRWMEEPWDYTSGGEHVGFQSKED